MRLLAAVVLLTLGWAGVAEAAKRPRLKAFASCTQLVDYARAGAERTGGRPGVTGRAAPMPVDAVTTPQIRPPVQSRSDVPTAMPVSSEGAAGGSVPDFSGTNVQELGIDEPDVLKTDGRRIFVVTDQTLRVVDVASGTVTGTLKLDGGGHVLLLRGDRVLAIAAKGGGGPQTPRGVPGDGKRRS